MRLLYNLKATMIDTQLDKSRRIKRGQVLSKAMTEHKPKKRDYIYVIVSLIILSGVVKVTFIDAKQLVSYAKTYVQEHKVEAKEAEPEYYNSTLLEYPELQYTVDEDKRVEKLQSYLQDNNSPLADHAEYIVEQSDLNGIDWTLIVAISKMESGFCTKTIPGSYNCWGLGGSNFMYFDSYEESIKFTAELLNKHYRSNMNQAIKAKYCPASDGCNPSWVDIVTDVSHELIAYKNVTN